MTQKPTLRAFIFASLALATVGCGGSAGPKAAFDPPFVTASPGSTIQVTVAFSKDVQASFIRAENLPFGLSVSYNSGTQKLTFETSSSAFADTKTLRIVFQTPDAEIIEGELQFTIAEAIPVN